MFHVERSIPRMISSNSIDTLHIIYRIASKFHSEDFTINTMRTLEAKYMFDG